MSCLYIKVLGYQVYEGFFLFLFFVFCLFVFSIRELIRKRESILRHTVGVSKRNSNEKSHVYVLRVLRPTRKFSKVNFKQGLNNGLEWANGVWGWAIP